VIDWIVVIVTLFAFGFVLLWWLAPRFRARVEQPKFDMLKRVTNSKESGRERRTAGSAMRFTESQPASFVGPHKKETRRSAGPD
jgi:hypothetical protein